MNFRKAWKAMKKGHKVKRPFWKGYWVWENGTIMMHCRDRKVEDIRDTEHVAYTFDNVAAKDWEIVNDDKSNEINVGDEVIVPELVDFPVVVLSKYFDDVRVDSCECYYVICPDDGSVMMFDEHYEGVKKTGRNFPHILKLLEEMNNEH